MTEINRADQPQHIVDVPNSVNMMSLLGPNDEHLAILERVFDADIHVRGNRVTLRGQSREKDGAIHTDSKTKLVTALIYLNSEWESDGGRLRMLNGPGDIEDYVAEVPPEAGTLVAFRCAENAWHGHKPFVGQRRSIQLNWLTDGGVLKRELRRHAFSAWTKKLLRFGA